MNQRKRASAASYVVTVAVVSFAAACATEPPPGVVVVTPPPPSAPIADAEGAPPHQETAEEDAADDPAPIGFGPLERARADNARVETQTISMAVELWQASHPDACPTFDELVRDKVMDPNKENEDPWGQPYAIQCSESGVSISSNGPDRELGTDDDIAHDP